ncbi:DUF998 domain-containing protein [Streptomyces sp. NPDC058195]|uniref:DUF998 domain-containing protein n=1 Tax=Streptomyces sp. NPDC058195 TaxID=3346375 RepID=UPI0036E39DCF
MTQTGSAPSATASVSSPRGDARALLAAGAAAGPLFLGAGVIQGLSREGFDFTRNAISQLGLGALGWIQMTSFALTGTLIIAGAIGMRRVLSGGPGGVRVPWLVGVFGASFLLCGVFAADAGAGFPAGTPQEAAGSLSAHGVVHMLGGMIGFLAWCVASFMLARVFAARGQRGWVLACRLVPAGILAGFAGSSATVLAFTAGAGLGLLWLTAVFARLFITAPAPRLL